MMAVLQFCCRSFIRPHRDWIWEMINVLYNFFIKSMSAEFPSFDCFSLLIWNFMWVIFCFVIPCRLRGIWRRRNPCVLPKILKMAFDIRAVIKFYWICAYRINQLLSHQSPNNFLFNTVFVVFALNQHSYMPLNVKYIRSDKDNLSSDFQCTHSIQCHTSEATFYNLRFFGSSASEYWKKNWLTIATTQA